MRRHTRRTGALLIEFMFALLCALLVGASLAVLIQCTYSSQNIVMGDNMTYVSARKTMDVLAAHLSDAQAYQTSASPVTYSVLSAGTVSSVTCYLDSVGNTERYWLDTTTSPPSLKRTQTISGVATTTVVVSGLATTNGLTFTYYITNGTNYTNSSWVSTTTTPTAANLPAVGAIGITATISINGYARQLTSFVRLRNSPYRS